MLGCWLFICLWKASVLDSSVVHKCHLHNVYMDQCTGKKIKPSSLFSCLYIDPYKRYVDDIYAQTTDESNADAFHEHMNNQHPNIKFKIEKPNPTPEGKCLSLLDFTVHLTKKPLFVHRKSALPKRSKVNIIHNERKCINQRCSTEANKNKHNNDLNYMLRLNGYPSNMVNGTLNRESHNSQAPQIRQ